MLKNPERYCRFVFDAVDLSLFELDLPSGSISMTPEFFKKYGYDPEEIPEDLNSLLKLIHPKEVPLINKALEELRNGKPNTTLEVRVRACNSSWKWSKVYLWVDERDSSNNSLKLIGIALDITSLKENQKQLELKDRYTQSMLNALPDMMFVISKDGVYLDFKAEDSSKLAVSPDKIIGSNIDDAGFSPESLKSLKKAIAEALETGKLQTVNYWLDTPAGEGFFEARISPIDNRKVLLVVRDFTEQKRAQQKLARLYRLRKVLTESTNDILSSPVETNPYQRFLEKMSKAIPEIGRATLLLKRESKLKIVASTSNKRLIGLKLPQELLNIYSDIGPAVIEFTEVEEYLPREFLTVIENRGIKLAEKAMFVPIESEGNKVGCLTLGIQKNETPDEESRKILELIASQISIIYKRLQLESNLREEHKKYKYLATHDSLTKLPNRRYLEERFERLKFSHEHFAFIYLSISKFRQINEVMGHMFGDAVLVDIAEKLVNILGNKKQICRLEGAKFVLMLPIGDRKSAMKFSNKIRRAFSEPFRIMKTGMTIRPVMSIVMYPEDGTSFAELIQNAEIAIHTAEKEEKDILFFDKTLSLDLSRRVFIEQELLRALKEDKGLTLHYQPIIDLNTGKISSVEALARWIHPEAGYIKPDLFVPVAEESGLIHELGRKVLNMASEQAKKWFERKIQIPVFVNLSAKELQREDIISQVRETLEKYNLPKNLLGIEVTESALMTDPEGGRKKIEQLRKMGVLIAIDDFGTGYSSLSYLRFMPVNLLKIDRSFIKDLTRESNITPKSISIIKSIITLANSLGFSVVAEGVEVDFHRLFLAGLGCDYAQGYYFYKPADASAVEKILKRRKIF
ncbi:bifunctional diguanylate cyclase/phosphodiesterase [Kosmotoga pacifica]|uniref:bifunctional diguanylate cyclase/phosphodiesterase n=1 Tax=Kosmotoga pacifica TaxID=1330330 RepID=UPI002355056D|nr:EAL domain-containing protein [Kosmotoga pacifica]